MRAADSPFSSTETAPVVRPLTLLVAYPVTCAWSAHGEGPTALSLSMKNPPTPATTRTTPTTARTRLYIVMTFWTLQRGCRCPRNSRASTLSHLAKLPRDNHPLDLVGALEDLRDLRLAHVPLNREVAGVAVAPEHLDGVGRHPHRHVGRHQLGDRRLAAELHPPVPAAGGVQVGRAGRLHPGRHVGQQELQPLEVDDRLAELGALL